MAHGDPLDPDRFLGGGVAGYDGHVAFSHRQEIHQEGHKRLVGLALFRRGGNGDSCSSIPFPQVPRARSSRHHFDG